MDSELRFSADQLITCAKQAAPETVNKWASFGFSAIPNGHPYLFYFDDFALGDIDPEVTHIACIGVLRIRAPIFSPVHIIAHTVVFEEEPMAKVVVTCQTLVLYGPGLYYPKLKLTEHPLKNVRHIYSLGSNFPFATQKNAVIFKGPIPLRFNPNFESQTGFEQLPMQPGIGLNEWHLMALQALTFREAADYIKKIADQKKSEITREIETFTSSLVNMYHLRDILKVPSLQPFRFLPSRDLSTIFETRNVQSLCTLIGIPFLSGYISHKVIDPFSLPKPVFNVMQESMISAKSGKIHDPEDIPRQR